MSESCAYEVSDVIDITNNDKTPYNLEIDEPMESLLDSVAKVLLRQTTAKATSQELQRLGVCKTDANRITNSQRRFHALSRGQE